MLRHRILRLIPFQVTWLSSRPECLQPSISPKSRQNKRRRVANSMIYILLTTLLSAGYGSLPKNTKREFKLFPFFQKASKYLRKISDRKQISRFGKFTVVFGMICTSHVPRTRIPHCKRDMQRYKFPFAKMYL